MKYEEKRFTKIVQKLTLNQSKMEQRRVLLNLNNGYPNIPVKFVSKKLRLVDSNYIIEQYIFSFAYKIHMSKTVSNLLSEE